jgi:hypothetical protein
VKTIFFAVIALLISATVASQSVTIRFEGTNSSTGNPLHYAVEVDGTIYYSYNAELGQNSRVRQLETKNLNWGNHRIAVYEVEENSTVNTSTNVPVYTNTFQLRSGYDMVIAIRRNGQVAFTEKKSTVSTAGVGTGRTPMSSAEFDKLTQSVKSKWSQTSKYNAIKSAFNNKANYFTTDQAGQLALLVSSETRRLELIKLSYPRITDPESFGDVVDLFSSQANKDNIQKFIDSKNPGTSATTEQYVNRIPMSDADFDKLQTKASLHFRQSSVVRDIKEALSSKNNYFTIGQIRALLSMVSNESDKLALAKLAYHRATDPNNFNQLFDVFASQSSVDNLNNYIRTTRS